MFALTGQLIGGIRLWHLLLCGICALIPLGVLHAQPVTEENSKKSGAANSNHSIAVIYPNVNEPYRTIFTKIIEGIEERSKLSVKSIPIENSVNTSELNTSLKHNGIRVVIALGRQGLKTSQSLDRDMAIIVGGILSVPEQENQKLTGTSFTPAPEMLFSRLKAMLPETKRVFVVYNPQQNESLIKLAKEEARLQKLTLEAIPVKDLASAAKAYEQIFATIDARGEAIWLPHDTTTVEENTLLPLILKHSWNAGAPIFSSNFLHVKKGALFAMYPNNLGLGRTLADSALSALAGDDRKRGVAPLRDLLTAVNLRTANRIGLHFSYQQQRNFDFVFPEP